MRRHRMFASLALVLVVLTGGACSGRSPAVSAGSSASGGPASTAPALDGCVGPAQGTLVDLGGGHQAAVLGGGATGVVLSNQSDGSLCDWLPFGKRLASSGFRVLLYDYGATADPEGDVELAAAKLRSFGAGAIVLVGASEGAKASLVAATTMRPPPLAVVSLSAERTLRGTDVAPAAAKLTAPVLFITARDDSLVGDATERLYQAAGRAAARRLETVPGDAHGTDLLAGAAGAKLQGDVLSFLRRYGVPPTTTSEPLRSAVAARCGAPNAAASLIHFRSGDGTRLDGALLGSGRAGVVLLHESPNDLCGFWPYAVYLAGKGLRVLDIDLRCFGESACPVAAKGTVIDDAVAAVAELKRRGAGSVALVGASAGAGVALAAGSRLGTGVAAVVSLSGERNLTLVIRDGGPLDLVNEVKRLTSPTLFEVATGDPTTSVDETRAMFAATRAPGKRIDILTGPYDHEHGWDLLTTAAGGERWSPVAAKVADFVKAHGAR
jgi:dienelactone hydrolase